jgi:hypothetical protein
MACCWPFYKKKTATDDDDDDDVKQTIPDDNNASRWGDSVSQTSSEKWFEYGSTFGFQRDVDSMTTQSETSHTTTTMNYANVCYDNKEEQT